MQTIADMYDTDGRGEGNEGLPKRFSNGAQHTFQSRTG